MKSSTIKRKKECKQPKLQPIDDNKNVVYEYKNSKTGIAAFMMLLLSIVAVSVTIATVVVLTDLDDTSNTFSQKMHFGAKNGIIILSLLAIAAATILIASLLLGASYAIDCKAERHINSCENCNKKKEKPMYAAKSAALLVGIFFLSVCTSSIVAALIIWEKIPAQIQQILNVHKNKPNIAIGKNNYKNSSYLMSRIMMPIIGLVCIATIIALIAAIFMTYKNIPCDTTKTSNLVKKHSQCLVHSTEKIECKLKPKYSSQDGLATSIACATFVVGASSITIPSTSENIVMKIAGSSLMLINMIFATIVIWSISSKKDKFAGRAMIAQSSLGLVGSGSIIFLFFYNQNFTTNLSIINLLAVSILCFHAVLNIFLIVCGSCLLNAEQNGCICHIKKDNETQEMQSNMKHEYAIKKENEDKLSTDSVDNVNGNLSQVNSNVVEHKNSSCQEFRIIPQL